jgi:hypothetical protein
LRNRGEEANYACLQVTREINNDTREKKGHGSGDSARTCINVGASHLLHGVDVTSEGPLKNEEGPTIFVTITLTVIYNFIFDTKLKSSSI